MHHAPDRAPLRSTSRREFLLHAAALAAAAPLAACASLGNSTSKNPFTLGVASGDPDSESVVLWTRLAPEPLADDGGMGDRTFEVAWEIAEDAAMQRVVQRGTVLCTEAEGHSVHVEAHGLPSGRFYWYRFVSDGFASPIGRTRTMPKQGDAQDRMALSLIHI
jgi:alkaline phosphatase D